MSAPRRSELNGDRSRHVVAEPETESGRLPHLVSEFAGSRREQRPHVLGGGPLLGLLAPIIER